MSLEEIAPMREMKIQITIAIALWRIQSDIAFSNMREFYGLMKISTLECLICRGTSLHLVFILLKGST